MKLVALAFGVLLLVAAKPVSVTLPADEALFPDGPQGELLAGNCTACHSASMISAQPRLTAAQWTATVDKMRTVYKAPIEDADVPAIVAALTAVSAGAGNR